MKKMSKILAITLVVVLLAGTALATNGSVKKVLDYMDISINVNGQEITPTDVNGNSTEPFAIDGTVYVPVRAISEYLGCEVEWDQGTKSVVIKEAEAAEPVLLATIVTRLEGDGGRNNTLYGAATTEDSAKYFANGDVNAVITAGNFYINNYVVPVSGDFTTAYPDGYSVNGAVLIEKGTGCWLYDGDECASLTEAVVALVNDSPAGLTTDLYDTDGDGYANIVKMWNKEGVVAHDITKNGDTYTISRGTLNNADSVSYEGRLYDSYAFIDEADQATAEKIIVTEVKADNFDTSIKEGDVMLFWEEPTGWQAQRAEEINGIFVEGSDHHYYNIDGVEYTDAMKFSRDNLIVANRNGEFANAHQYFGFNAGTKKVSLWLAPESKAPIGLTSNENADYFLGEAIKQAEAKLAAVTLADDATEDQKFAYAALEEAIAAAKEIQADKTADYSQKDFYVYYLYLTLNGTGNDIGAAFAGFYGVNGWGFKNAYPGFDSVFSPAE